MRRPQRRQREADQVSIRQWLYDQLFDGLDFETAKDYYQYKQLPKSVLAWTDAQLRQAIKDLHPGRTV